MINIGSQIKSLRRRRDLTQEQLAEYLNVSVSAVSQWESQKTLPDISTVLALAEFFDCSLDELFDRTTEDKQKIKDEYFEKSNALANKGDVRGEIALWREAVQRFPGDFDCHSQLAVSLNATALKVAIITQASSCVILPTTQVSPQRTIQTPMCSMCFGSWRRISSTLSVMIRNFWP